MGKIKIAICIGDAQYQERFVKCLMNHYRERYELHIFEEVAELLAVERRQYAGYILGEEAYQSLGGQEADAANILVLNEENKYQEVYKLMEELELLLGDYLAAVSGGGSAKRRVVGVYSLTHPHMQMPFAALVSGIYAEKGKTILLDFQADSGLRAIAKGGEAELGMEDVMAIAMAGNYSKSRLLSAIGHSRKWDYVYPVKNSRCLQEVSGEMVSNIIHLLSTELEYRTIIVNLGDSAAAICELAEELDACYFLYPKGDGGIWRERNYIEEMERRGKDDVLHRITRVEIPAVSGADADWEGIVEQWKWNNVGNVVRKLVWEEIGGGQAV